jgi:hypothetical protein
MDTDSAKILHNDYRYWSRLDVSRTCRLMFAETATRYFELKLLPLSANTVAFSGLSTSSAPPTILQSLNSIQAAHIKEVFLSLRQADDICWETGYNWPLEELPNLQVILLPFGYEGLYNLLYKDVLSYAKLKGVKARVHIFGNDSGLQIELEAQDLEYVAKRAELRLSDAPDPSKLLIVEDQP